MVVKEERCIEREREKATQGYVSVGVLVRSSPVDY